MPRLFRLSPRHITAAIINHHQICLLTLKHATSASAAPEIIALQSLTLSNTTIQQPRKSRWKYAPYRQQPVIIGLPLTRTILKEITLDDSLTDAEIYQHLRQQATKILGLESSHLYLDYEFTPSPETVQALPRHLRVTATSQETITQLTDRCRDFGYSIQAVDVAAYGLIRALPFLTHYSSECTSSQAIATLDENGVTLCVQDPHLRSYFKTLPYPNDAIPPSEEDTLQALQATLQFFLNTHPHLFLTQVWVLGFTTTLPAELSINGRANLPLYPAHLNAAGLQISSEHLQEFTTQMSHYLACLGLALRGQTHEI